MSLIVHGTALSPFVRKVIVALEEKGVPYEQIEQVRAGLLAEEPE